MSSKMHFTYAIVNKLNGKTYIGVHSTNDVNDGYMGSGKLIKRAINKYGVNNFDKIILNYYSTSQEAYKEEALLVDEDFLQLDWTYNLTTGGGAVYMTPDIREKIGEANRGRVHSEETVEKNRQARLKYYQENESVRKGATHTEEAKDKLSKAHTGKIHSEEHKRNISKSMKTKPIINTITGVEYHSLPECVKAEGISQTTLHRKLNYGNKKNKDFYLKYK